MSAVDIRQQFAIQKKSTAIVGADRQRPRAGVRNLQLSVQHEGIIVVGNAGYRLEPRARGNPLSRELEFGSRERSQRLTLVPVSSPAVE
jgi:hypothetical protein